MISVSKDTLDDLVFVVYRGEACALVARCGKRVGETAMGAQKDEKWLEGRSETALDGRAAGEQKRREGRKGKEEEVRSV